MRGYSLFAILVFSVIILSGALVLLSLGRESQITGVQEKQSSQAYGVAHAGLQWMLANLSNSGGKDAAVEAAAIAPTPVLFASKNLHGFDAADKFAGVGVGPPAKASSNVDWTALGEGHYGLVVAVDPLDSRRSVLIRSIGVVGQTQVVLETSLKLNITQTVPSGFTGCFESDFQIKFKDEEGPYDYTGSFRMDGNLGVPMAISTDHNRLNGLARVTPSAGPSVPSPDPAYSVGRRWRGMQSLRSGLLPSGVSNRYGGQQGPNLFTDEIGPLPLWERNAWIANDPRIVDEFSATGAGPQGLRLNAGGFVYGGGTPSTDFKTGTLADNDPIQGQRGSALIAYIDGPAAAANTDGALMGIGGWTGEKDELSRKGLYACDDHSGGGSGSNQNTPTEVCLKGSTGTSGPNWTNDAVNHSGRAWGIVQSVLRQCTGSGNSINPITGSPFHDTTNNPNGIKCSPGFEWLENVAACTILPANIAAAKGTNALRDPFEDAVGVANNFRGCHPGCLLATDLDGDGDLDSEDRPFRSACINLDAANVSAYGPGVYPNKDLGTAFDAVYPRTPPVAGTSAWVDYNRSKIVVVGGSETDLDSDGVLDPVDDVDQGAGFFPADAAMLPTSHLFLKAGAVGERGNSSFITRLDMGDRGPLGTCEQNCLAFGFGKDVTFGAHRTDMGSLPGVIGVSGDPNCSARVFKHDNTAGTMLVHCNWDSDYDGFLDRKSWALNSAYREECADPHDGMSWAPAFNISSSNTSLGGTGCRNNIPGMHVDTKPIRLVPFCEDGNDAELNDAIDTLELSATSITANELNKSTPDIADGNGWFGGAVCHMGATTFDGTSPHPHTGRLNGVADTDVDQFGHPDYWIEDRCPDPVVLKVDSSADVNIGKVCGCGIIIFGDNSFLFNNTSTFLWRGLVIWRQKTAGKTLRITGNGAGTFAIEGAMLTTGTSGMEIEIEKKVSSGSVVSTTSTAESVKWNFRMNPTAIAEALAQVKTPLRSVRRVR